MESLPEKKTRCPKGQVRKNGICVPKEEKAKKETKEKKETVKVTKEKRVKKTDTVKAKGKEKGKVKGSQKTMNITKRRECIQRFRDTL